MVTINYMITVLASLYCCMTGMTTLTSGMKEVVSSSAALSFPFEKEGTSLSSFRKEGDDLEDSLRRRMKNICDTSCDWSCDDGCDLLCDGDCDLSCDGGCNLGCDGDCDNSCDEGCDGIIPGTLCDDDCDASCDGDCDAGCDEECDNGCDDDCDRGCDDGCDHGCDEDSDGHACVADDPHFTTFDGRKYIFKEPEGDDLEKQLYDYMAPCNSSDLYSHMPLKLSGKHFLLMPEKGYSGLEYVTLQLYDYDEGNMYVIWVNSIIHGWMKVDLTMDSQASLMYHDYNETKQLQSDEWMHFGSKFKFLFKQVSERKVDTDLYIDGKCHLNFGLFFQTPGWVETDTNGRHAMHKFEINTECYRCSTCGLLGSHLCDNVDSRKETDNRVAHAER